MVYNWVFVNSGRGSVSKCPEKTLLFKIYVLLFVLSIRILFQGKCFDKCFYINQSTPMNYTIDDLIQFISSHILDFIALNNTVGAIGSYLQVYFLSKPLDHVQLLSAINLQFANLYYVIITIYHLEIILLLLNLILINTTITPIELNILVYWTRHWLQLSYWYAVQIDISLLIHNLDLTPDNYYSAPRIDISTLIISY